MASGFDSRVAATRRAGGAGSRGLLLALLVVLGAVAVGGALIVSGVWSLEDPEPKPVGPPAGTVAVPISAADIPEYTKVLRDHLWDGRKRQLTTVNISQNEVTPGMFIKIGDIVGRVLRRPKRGSYVFTEDDFYPKGTRPGIVAGVPPGARALRLDATKIEGVAGLVPGDVFDMVATIAVEAKGIGKLPVGGHLQSQLGVQAAMSNWSKQATVRVVVQAGTVVAGLAVREVPISNQTFGRGRQRTTMPVQEVVLAVKPDEVAPVTEALAVEAKLMVVPHSGLPGDHAGTLEGHSPWTPFEGTPSGLRYNGVGPLEVVETISGTQRQMTAVPGG